VPYDPSHEALLHKILATFESCDAEATANLYEEDADYYLYPEVIRGREAIRESMEDWFRAFPDTKWELQNLMSSGDTFVAEGIFKATHTGPMRTPEGEVPATGRAVEMPCCFIGRVSENGLIAEDRTYINQAIMMEQLGLT
jgi:steroid delta-isomerase-like uncharacterized protein